MGVLIIFLLLIISTILFTNVGRGDQTFFDFIFAEISNGFKSGHAWLVVALLVFVAITSFLCRHDDVGPLGVKAQRRNGL